MQTTSDQNTTLSKTDFDKIYRVGSSVEKEIEREKLTQVLNITDNEVLAAAITTIKAVSFEPIRDMIRYIAIRHTLNPKEKEAWQKINRHRTGHSRKHPDFDADIKKHFNALYEGGRKSVYLTRKNPDEKHPIDLLLPSVMAFEPHDKNFTEIMGDELLDALQRYTCNLSRPLSDKYKSKSGRQADQKPIQTDGY